MIDPAAFKKALVNSGVDTKLQQIAEQTAGEVAKIQSLDVASLTPSALQATMKTAQETVESTAKVMLDAADALKPQLPKLQDMMGDVLAATGPAAAALQGSLNELIEAAGGAAAGIPSVDSLKSDALGSLQVPDLGGLDALSGAIGEATTGLAGTLADAAGGLKQALTTTSIPSISAGGFDPGKMIPNIEFKTEPTFDEDGVQNGTSIIAIKLGKPATAPVQDAKNDAPPIEINLQEVAETMASVLDEAQKIAHKATLPKRYDKASDIGPTTDVVYNPATKVNIVWETQTGPDGNPIMVPSGYPSIEQFKASYSDSLNRIRGQMLNTAATVRQTLPELTEAFQDVAKQIKTLRSSQDGQEHKATESKKAPGIPIQKIEDKITGMSVDLANALNIVKNMEKELPDLVDGIEEQLNENLFTPLTQLGEEMEKQGFKPMTPEEVNKFSEEAG